MARRRGSSIHQQLRSSGFTSLYCPADRRAAGRSRRGAAAAPRAAPRLAPTVTSRAPGRGGGGVVLISPSWKKTCCRRRRPPPRHGARTPSPSALRAQLQLAAAPWSRARGAADVVGAGEHRSHRRQDARGDVADKPRLRRRGDPRALRRVARLGPAGGEQHRRADSAARRPSCPRYSPAVLQEVDQRVLHLRDLRGGGRARRPRRRHRAVSRPTAAAATSAPAARSAACCSMTDSAPIAVRSWSRPPRHKYGH